MNAIDKKIEPQASSGPEDGKGRLSWLGKFSHRGEEGRKEKAKEDSKHARRVRAELKKRRDRIISILFIGTIGASITGGVLGIGRYISVNVDKALLKTDIDGLDRNSWKRTGLNAVHFVVDFLVPDYELYGRLDAYHELVDILPQDVEKIGIFVNPLEVKIIQPRIKVDEYGTVYVAFRICGINCDGNPQTLDTIQTRKIGKIEKGRLFFLENVNLNGNQRNYIAQKLLKKED